MRILFPALLVLASAGTAAMSDQVVAYTIRARLDPLQKTISGQETLAWRNTSGDAVAELRFHLYLNAFSNTKSSFMRESGGQLRSDRAQQEGWGYVDIKRMQVAGGPDLTAAIRFIHPDDDNADDRTVIAVALPQPVKPGQTLTLAIDFLSKLPKVFARTGYHDDFFMAGQWFPKIGVYEKPGDRYAVFGGWNCHQFHANTEFYADYGRYDVSITVPSAYVVGATGVERSRSEDPARRETTYQFQQEDIHDFAWTASPRYLRLERRFDPAAMVSRAEAESAAKLLGVPTAELALKPVRMILLLQPEHSSQAERHFRAIEAGLKWFGMWYGAYPYDTITVVDPPYGAGGAGGMEYPTLITAGTSWWPGGHELGIEGVIVHEFGHQYWYGMVGSNEFEESWLDEGFNTYSTGKIVDMVYGPGDLPVHAFGIPVAGLLGLPRVTDRQTNRGAYLFYGKHDPVVRNGWQYYDGMSYSLNSYMRPATLLLTLEGHLGSPVMARIMRAWYQRYKFRHPTSADFERLVNEVSGRNMSWFFDQFVLGTNWLNYQVASVDSKEIGVFAGSFVENGKRVTVTEQDAERQEKDRERNRQFHKQYRIVVKLARTGEAVFPVEMKMTLDNGETVREQWDGRERWVKYEYLKYSPAKSVVIDPENKILLDGSFADNSWVAKPAIWPFAKWASNILFWIEAVLP